MKSTQVRLPTRPLLVHLCNLRPLTLTLGVPRNKYDLDSPPPMDWWVSQTSEKLSDNLSL